MKAIINNVQLDGTAEEIFAYVKLITHTERSEAVVHKKGKKIKVTDTKGNNRIYNSIMLWAKDMGVPYKLASKNLRQGPWKYGEWFVERITE